MQCPFDHNQRQPGKGASELGGRKGMQRESLGVQKFLGHISPSRLLGFGFTINIHF